MASNWFEVYAMATVLEISHGQSVDLAEGMMFEVRELFRAYRKISLEVGPGNVDYNDSDCRAAYLYLYGPLHSELVKQRIMQMLREKPIVLDRLKRQSSVNLVSIGGGPGSDVIGARSALIDMGLWAPISASVFDLHQWQDTFNAVCKASGQLQPNDSYHGGTNFLKLDQIESTHWRDYAYVQALAKADLVTIVKFVSVIGHEREKTEFFLKHMKYFLKPGAVVLYIDNGGGGFTEIVEPVMKEDMSYLRIQRRFQFKLDPIDFRASSANLSIIRDRMKTEPLYECAVAVAFWQKPMTSTSPIALSPFQNQPNFNFFSPFAGYRFPTSSRPLIGGPPYGLPNQIQTHNPFNNEEDDLCSQIRQIAAEIRKAQK